MQTSKHRNHSAPALILVVYFLTSASVLAQSQGTVSTAGGSGAPGSAFSIPVTLSLNSGVSADAVTFGLQIAPNGNAPALTGILSFTPGASLPAPIVDTSGGANVINVAWLTPISPPLSGTKALGTVTMTIPAGAQNAQTYSICITGASAALGTTPVNLTPGPCSTLTVIGPPTISLNPTSLTFNAQQGGQNPPGQTVTVSNSGGGTLSWTATASTSSGGNWLSVSPGSGTNTGTLTVSVNITGLSAITYNGTIQVAATGASNTPQTINVTLNVSPLPPAIGLSATALTFTGMQGGANPANQTVNVSNSGGGTLNWTTTPSTSSGGSWLSVSPGSGTNTGTLTVSVNITGLSAITYNGTIQVAATGASNTPQTIPVTLNVSPLPPAIGLSATALTFTGMQGGANPANQTVNVSNSGGGTLNWTTTPSTSSGGSWLSVSPGSGTNSGTLTVSVNISGLAVGTYNGTIQVAATGASNTPRTINVTLTITPPPTIALGTTALSFAGVQGGANPASQMVTVSNSGGGTLNWTATASTSGGSWLGVSPASGTGAGTLTISVNIAGLVAGTYIGSVQVAAAGASNTPQNIAIQLIVQPPPAIALNPTALTFTAQLGSSPPPQSFSVGNSGGGAFNWTATISSITGGNWLAILPTSGAPGSTVTLTVNSSALALGTYSATISVAAAGVGNSPQAVAVTLNVVLPPELVLSASSLIFNGNTGTNLPTQQLTISSSGGSLNWTAAVATQSGGNWLTITPASGASPSAVIVLVTATGLAAGTYQGSITVSAFGASNSPQTVSVTLTLTSVGQAVIALNPGLLQFTTNAGANPPSQTLQVTNAGSGALGWTATATTQSGGNWLSVSPTTGVAPSTLTVTVNSASLAAGNYIGSITITALASANASNSPQVVSVQLSVGSSRPPVIFQGGIVNGAGFAPGTALAPGGIISVFGQSLAPREYVASSLPLPRSLGGVRVLIESQEAPLFYVGPGQVNAQLPFELDANRQLTVVVESNGVSSAPQTVQMAPQSPGIFTLGGSFGSQGAILIANTNRLAMPVTVSIPSEPAQRGGFVSIFCTGLGATQPAVASGYPGPTDPLALVKTPVTVTMGGLPAVVTFAGLAPGFVGVYQVNAQVPAGVTPGNAVPVVLTQAGISSNTVTIAVR